MGSLVRLLPEDAIEFSFAISFLRTRFAFARLWGPSRSFGRVSFLANFLTLPMFVEYYIIIGLFCKSLCAVGISLGLASVFPSLFGSGFGSGGAGLSFTNLGFLLLQLQLHLLLLRLHLLPQQLLLRLRRLL